MIFIKITHFLIKTIMLLNNYLDHDAVFLTLIA